MFSCGNVLQPELDYACAAKMAAGIKPMVEDREDLMQIPGPITEAAILKTLASRFQAKKYQVPYKFHVTDGQIHKVISYI